jgi:outer membrane protein insertion porin family
MLPRLVAFSLLGCLIATAQKTALPPTFNIRALHIRGNKNLPEAGIAGVTGLAVGQKVGKAELDAAKDRLLATGMFETVAFQFEAGTDGQCCVATYEVAEVTSLFPIQFDNIPEPDADIIKFLKDNVPLFEPMLPGTVRVIDFYARQVERYLAMKNHAGSVLGALVPTGKNEYKITFRMNQSLPAISNVTFSGNKAISAVTLQNAINDVAYGQPFTRDGFRLLLENQVKPLYDAMGMIRVKFLDFTTQPDPRVKGIAVQARVDEGGVYKLEKVTITGADRDSIDTAKIKTGVNVNFDEVKAGLERVLVQLRKDGYMHVTGDTDRKIDDEAKTVVVNLAIERGDQYTFGKLTIVGLDLNSEPAVRKLWSVAPGKPFNATYPQFFLDRIKEDGYFDNLGATKPTIQIDEKTRVVDVTLTFTAARNRSIPRPELP